MQTVFVKIFSSPSTKEILICSGCKKEIEGAYICYDGYWHLNCGEKEAKKRNEDWI